MITKLDHLTIGQFFNLVCGETDILLKDSDKAEKKDIAKVLRNIVFEYREIADPSGARSCLSRIEELTKARISVVLFTICNNLISIKQYSRIREIFEEYGIDTRLMSDERLVAETLSRLERAKNTVAEISSDHKHDTDLTQLRRGFDTETAAIMAHFKFQIDTSTMKAAVYANLVARRNLEIRAKLASLKSK